MTRREPDDAWHSRPAASVGPADDASPRVSEPAERFRAVRPVGVGGMGRVDAVHDAVLEREVAKKTVKPGAPAGAAARLAREARLAAALDHPGIVPIFDAGTDEHGDPWYTMRLVRGRPLGDVVRDTPVVADRLALLPRVLAAAHALAHAHAHGVVHRDLTPNNVLVGPFGETVVIDWGLARRVDGPDDVVPTSGADGDPALTRVGAVVGTPAWMAPEQARGEPADRRSDVHNLGRLVDLVVRGDVSRPWPTDVPRDLAALVARATDPDRDARYPDAAAFAADLEAWLAGRRVSAHDYSPRELATRLARAWRAPLLVAAFSACVLAATGAVAVSRTVAERQRVTELLMSTEADLAGRLLRDGDDAEAARHADVALALGDHPEARLVRAAVGEVPRRIPRVVLLPAECRDVALAPRSGLACGTGAEILAFDDDGRLKWRRPGAGRLGFGGPTGPVQVSSRARFASFDADTGDLLVDAAPEGIARYESLPVPAPQGWAGALAPRAEVVFVDDDGHERMIECPKGDQALAVAVRGEGWAIACGRGLALVGSGADVDERWAIPPRSSALAARADGSLLVGTLDAALFAIPPGGGDAERLLELAVGPIRELVPSPDGRRFLVLADHGNARVVDPASRAVWTLPVAPDRAAWRGDDAIVVVDGTAVWQWVLPVRPSRIHAEHGVGAVAVGARVWFGDGSGIVRAIGWDGRSVGRVALHDAVVKDLAPEDHAAVFVASARAPGLTRWGPGGVETWIEAHGVRSVALRRGAAWITYWGDHVGRVTGPLAFERAIPGMYGRIAPCGDAFCTTREVEGDFGRLDVESGAFTSLVSGAGVFAVSDDGRLAVAVGPEVALVAQDGGPAGSVRLPEEPVSLALVGPMLFSGHVDGTVRVHDVDGHLIGAARLHTDRVGALAATSSARAPGRSGVVVTGSWDGTLRMIDVELLLSAGGPRSAP